MNGISVARSAFGLLYVFIGLLLSYALSRVCKTKAAKNNRKLIEKTGNKKDERLARMKQTFNEIGMEALQNFYVIAFVKMDYDTEFCLKATGRKVYNDEQIKNGDK